MNVDDGIKRMIKPYSKNPPSTFLSPFSLNNTLTPAYHSFLLCEDAVGIEIISLAKTYLGYITTSSCSLSDAKS